MMIVLEEGSKMYSFALAAQITIGVFVGAVIIAALIYGNVDNIKRFFRRKKK